MPILIDGHNLIPKIPGFSLSQFDDEQSLVVMVQEYCRIRRKQAEIFFDHALLGHSKPRRMGTLVVKFAHSGRTADQDIKKRLHQLGRQARNYIVVTSDGSIQTEAKAVQAQVVPSEVFAREMLDALRSSTQLEKPEQEEKLSQDELAWWLHLFNEGQTKKR